MIDLFLLISTGLNIALIVVFLQQIEKVRSAAQDRKSALDDLAKAKEAITAQADLHGKEIERMKIDHLNEIGGKNREIKVLDAQKEAALFMVQNPAIVSQYKEALDKERLPGAHTG